MASTNAFIAKTGFRAEEFICSQVDIKHSLETYFQLCIKEIKRVHGKKYDIIIEFINGTYVTIQNKNGGNGRGWSVDRRKVDKFEESLTILLKTLCLKKGTEKPTLSEDSSKHVIRMCMFGINEYPNYFTHSILDKQTEKIISLYICKTDELMNCINHEVYNTMVPKRTCVHLSPNIYLQRKGGGKKDTRPDDIQMKFKLTDKVKSVFTSIYENHDSITGTNVSGTLTTILFPR